MLQILKLALLLFKKVAARLLQITTFSKKGLFLAIVFAIIRRIRNASDRVTYLEPCVSFLNNAAGF